MFKQIKGLKKWRWKKVLHNGWRRLLIGTPLCCHQNIDDRRAAHVASTVLAREKESRVDVNDIELEGITFRIVSPRNASGALPCVIYYHGGCFVSGGLSPTTINCGNWLTSADVGLLPYSTASRRSTPFRRRMTMPRLERISVINMQNSWVSIAAV